MGVDPTGGSRAGFLPASVVLHPLSGALDKVFGGFAQAPGTAFHQGIYLAEPCYRWTEQNGQSKGRGPFEYVVNHLGPNRLLPQLSLPSHRRI